MLEFGGRLGHCKQAQRKGRFILLGVSQEEIKWKVPWSSHLVPGHPWEGGIPLGGRTMSEEGVLHVQLSQQQLLDEEVTWSAAGDPE